MVEAIDAQVDAMLKVDFEKPAQSEWNSSVVMRKSDGSLQFYIDYRQLNERIVKHSYPLIRTGVYLDAQDMT